MAEYDIPVAFARAVALPHANPVFEAPTLDGPLVTDAAFQLLDILFKGIGRSKTVADCIKVFDYQYYQECLRLLRTTRQKFVQESDLPAIPAREEYAKCWALALSRNEEWAQTLDRCRKTALKLLYKVCDICADATRAGYPSLVQQHFQPRRVASILADCLVMDRANCLYNMIDDETGERGLVWYSKGTRLPHGMPLNHTGATMNWRFKWLDQNLDLGDPIHRWMQPEIPDRLVEWRSHP